MATQRHEFPAGKIILGGFLLALAALIVWFALDFGGLLPGDKPVLDPAEPASIVPEASN